jgi:hypothetical protein
MEKSFKNRTHPTFIFGDGKAIKVPEMVVNNKETDKYQN